MATRSTIALEYADGTIHQIYCHWDGYFEGVGKTLLKHYTDPFKVRELIDLGDISSLGEVIGEQHPFSHHSIGMSLDEHEEKYGNMTTAYGRDRGEFGVASRKFISYDVYAMSRQVEEFDYVLRTDGKWYVSDHGRPFVELTQVLEVA